MKNKPTSKKQLGVLIQPKNLLKTIASAVPGASIGATILDQLEGYEFEQRIENLESQQKAAAKLIALEQINKRSLAINDWSIPTSQFLRRTIDIAVAYDGGLEVPEKSGHDLILPVAHACLIGDHEILSCSEAFDLALEVARYKKGRVVILAGFAWYDYDPQPLQDAVGLRIHRLTYRDEGKWVTMKTYFKENSEIDLDLAQASSAVSHQSNVWQGQECGFVHSGEATDLLSVTHSYSKLQFETSSISHFKKPQINGLKVAVSGVLGSRFTRIGSPVFSREGELIGILSDSENYDSDAGRRAVIRTLLGLPRFTKTKSDEK